MGGSTTFQEALASRLAIINPSRAAVDQYVATHPPQYSPGLPFGACIIVTMDSQLVMCMACTYQMHSMCAAVVLLTS